MCRCPLFGYKLTVFVKVTFSFVFFLLLKSISVILKERELQQDESSWVGGTGNLVHVKQLCVILQIFLSCLIFHMRKKYFRKIENSVEIQIQCFVMWLATSQWTSPRWYFLQAYFYESLIFSNKMKSNFNNCSTWFLYINQK